MKIIFTFLILSGLVGCSCSEQKLSKLSLVQQVMEADKSAELVLPDSMNKGIDCSTYPSGCIAGHMVRIRGLIMLFIEYQDKHSARIAAEQLGQYSLENWVLDDVAGEPLLEDFVEKHLGAKRSDNAGPRKRYFEANK